MALYEAERSLGTRAFGCGLVGLTGKLAFRNNKNHVIRGLALRTQRKPGFLD